MYAVIHRFTSTGDIDEAFRRTECEYSRALELQIGFVGHQVVRTGPAEAISVLLFETEDEADRNRYFTEQFIGVGLAGLGVEVHDEWRGDVQIDSRP
jgi:hypothetical protein